MSPRAITVVAITVALCLWGALNFYEGMTREGAGDLYKIQEQLDRYSPLLARLPATGTFGYLSDLPYGNVKGQVLFFVAQYALAPRLLSSQPDGSFVIGSYSQPFNWKKQADEHGLELVEDFNNGLLLFRRRDR